jgi:cytochrome c biogenesis protein CcdA
MRRLLPLILLLLASAQLAGTRLVIEFFYHPSCEECMERKRLMEELEREYFPRVVVEWWNTAEREGMERFMEYNLSRWPAAVFDHNPETALYDLREETLREVIEHYLEEGELKQAPKPLKRPELTIPLVIVSGLIDGFNPCAFSLLIFFISFLFTLKRGRLRVLGMGLTYILGVYLGYISIGVGLLRTVTLLGLQRPFALLGVALLALMGLLQIRDAIGFEAPLLRFPRFAAPSYHRLVERATLPVAFALGVFVSLLEFPCSGSVYIGILILLASGVGFSSGLLYLILYNLMFVLPLLILLFLASNLEVLTRMDEWRAAQRRRMKLVSGFLLLTFAPLIWLWLLTQ